MLWMFLLVLDLEFSCVDSIPYMEKVILAKILFMMALCTLMYMDSLIILTQPCSSLCTILAIVHSGEIESGGMVAIYS